jgi:hypothetical protein
MMSTLVVALLLTVLAVLTIAEVRKSGYGT